MAARTGKAQLVGLIGDPIGHSLSPAIHEYWIAKAGIDAAYLPWRQRAEDFPGLIGSLRGLDLRGFNVTVPYKQAMLDHLDICDPVAARIGAVNTVVVDDGKWHGLNTDAVGFMAHLTASAPAASLERVVLLGAGGAARAVAAGMASAGAGRIVIVNRDGARAKALIADYAAEWPQTEWAVAGWDDRHDALDGASLLVHTTSLGMAGMTPLELRVGALPRSAVVADIVYAPLETTLLREARAGGLATVDGIGMLIGQAAEAFQAWFGILPASEPGLLDALARARESGEGA